MRRLVVLVSALFIFVTAAFAGEVTLLKRTVYITPQKFLRYWKDPKAAEPVYNTNAWYPKVQFDVLGPLAAGSKLVVEIDHPNGTQWLTVNVETPALDDDVLETIRPASIDSNVEEKLASIETGSFPFRIKVKTSSNAAGTILFAGKFNVVLLTLDQNIPENKGKKEFMVDYDWHLPLAYLWLNPAMDADVPNISTQVCLKGKVEAGSVHSYVFYNGKQIAEGASNTPSQTLTSGADEPHHRYTILQSNFTSVRGFNKSQSLNSYTGSFFLDKNPGDYEVRIMRNGQLARMIKFSVGTDGAIVDNGFAKNLKLGGVRMIFPAAISGGLDGAFNASAWKTDAAVLAILRQASQFPKYMFRRVYLDNSATTPIDPAVVEAMMPYLTGKFGNASSIHFYGQEARGALDKARHQVAALINARPNEVVFTSGGTEANNLAIRGLLEANEKYGKHLVTSAIEHSAVKNVCEDLEKQGYSVTYLPVYENGLIRIADAEAAVTDETVLISIMAANNEIGTIQPVAEIGKLVKKMRESGRKIWFHTDAVQAAGKITVNVEEIGCDMLSVSAHKIYAPKGVGALYVRRGVRLHPQNIGGHQERERRGGTESVPNIVAFGKACEMANAGLTTESALLKDLRDTFESKLSEAIPDIIFNGDPEVRLPNISNISFRSIEGEGLLINLDMQGVAVSTGSACSSGSLEPSPVIRALGRDDELARGVIRFSFGRFNTAADVEQVLRVLPAAVQSLRSLSPFHKNATG